MDTRTEKGRIIPLLSILAMGGGLGVPSNHPWFEARASAAHATGHAVAAPAPGKTPCRSGNRLYRRQNGAAAYWRDTDIQRVSVEHVPWSAVPAAGGLYADDGTFYARIRMEDGVRAVRVLVDGSIYRIRMDDGSHGPRIVQQTDGTWDLLPLRDDYLPGTILAHVVPENVTAHAGTLQHAARIMEVMGMSELTLANVMSKEGSAGAAPFTYLAVAHAMMENLPARLRDTDAAEWSAREVRLLAPAMAALIGRPLVIGDGAGARFSFFADGREGAGSIPEGAAEIRWEQGRFLLGADAATGSQTDYPTVFAAVEAATRPPTNKALLPSEWEASFRVPLAAAWEARSSRPELESMLRQWLDPLAMPESERRRLKSIARLRHALFDRHHALTAAEEQRLLETTWSLMPAQQRIAIEVRRRDSHALLTRIDGYSPTQEQIVIAADLDAAGHRIAYYRVDAHGEAIRSRRVERSFAEIIDAILSGGDGRVSARLGVATWDWQGFADKLLARIADDERALLPVEQQPLAIRDEAILRHAANQVSDYWTTNDGHHYARLRNLDGRTQVVEIAPVAGALGYEILQPPGVTGLRATAFITWRDDKWYPYRLRDWQVTLAGAEATTGSL